MTERVCAFCLAATLLVAVHSRETMAQPAANAPPAVGVVRFERILGFGHSVDGSSHLCSVADILLGAFRYCVNEPDNEEAGKAMFPTLISMMWKRERDGKNHVNECGLVFRPQNVKEPKPKHQTEYNSLLARLQSYLT